MYMNVDMRIVPTNGRNNIKLPDSVGTCKRGILNKWSQFELHQASKKGMHLLLQLE